MNEAEYRVVRDHTYGFGRLEPLPEPDELAEFYESHYYHLIRQGGRAAEIRHLMAGGEEAARERSWLKATVHADIAHFLSEHAPGKRVLDIGSGTGELLSSLQENGFEGVGVEPSAEAAGLARDKGLTVHQGTFEEFVASPQRTAARDFDAAILINVVEHVPDPAALIELTRQVLKPGGILGIRVPNDFNELQLAAQKALGSDAWWIAAPDHINYFDFESLRRLMEGLGFDIVQAQGDFPMELFLLMGDNYVGNPEVGDVCHRKRILFETNIPAELRRRFYTACARIGVGRDCFVFGRLRDS